MNHANPTVPFLPTREALETPQKEERASPIKLLPLHSGEGCDLWILHPFGKDNNYSLKTILFSKFGPRLKLFPMLPPKQRSSLLVAPTNSK